MKKILIITVVVVLTLALSLSIGAKSKDCVTIQDGILKTSDGEVIVPGYDEYGYNYQAHQYVGYYDNYSRPADPVDEGDRLMMKWNDAWLSNKDCDKDGKLDRHYGFDSYIGSGAWLTNHQSGTYEDVNGKIVKWSYFCKIVAVPADATAIDGIWYAADGTEIGPVIWGAFAIIQEISNDPGTGDHGKLYLSPAGPGFGHFK